VLPPELDIGMVKARLEFLDPVPLPVELLALELGQLLPQVDVVEIIPVLLDPESGPVLST